MATIQGNCFICGKTAGKTAIKNHIMKEHGDGGEQDKWTFDGDTLDQSEVSRTASNRPRNYEWVIDEKNDR